ncbi:hypothetical protein [Streptomyces odontomachi]|uniref:hypothetical protein n=1 Tax=Streptomyces odontomachi TaxID=2944940 RepID=UPI00210C56F2|nr:hypothetical protein [Streptomyces sp. ODS25]
MTVLTLASEVLAVTVKQFLRWPYGPAGLAGLLLLAIGLKTGKTAFSSAGAVILALVIAAPSR